MESNFHETSCQLGVYTKPRASLAYTRNQPLYVQDDARRVSREHRDVVTSIVFQEKASIPLPLYVCMYVCHLNFIENLQISGLYYGNTINDRALYFCMSARYMLKAKSVQYEVLSPLGSWFSRYPIFKVYLIVYNSAGKFSTNVETTIFRTHSPTRSPDSISLG